MHVQYNSIHGAAPNQHMHVAMPSSIAGTPPPTSTSFCSRATGWCYRSTSTAVTFSAAAAACAANSTNLVRFSSAEEQLELERAGIVASGTSYWMGLSYATSAWTWQDGTVLQAAIIPSNTSPYAHW
jgi:hypothetical protein